LRVSTNLHFPNWSIMSEFIKSQQETKANLVEQVRSVIDAAETEARGLVAEEVETINRIEADIRKADQAIEIAQRQEERKAEAATAAAGFVPAVESRNSADLFRAMARGEVRGHEFGFESRATLVPSVNTVPVSFLDRVYLQARLVGPMLETSEVINRTSGEDLRIPVLTAYSASTAVSAGSAIPESEPTFSSILLQPSKQAFIIPVASELLSDAGFDIEGTLAEQAGNAIGFGVNAAMTTKLVAAAGSGVVGGTTAITADQLIDLTYSIDGAARRLPGVGYMVSTSTLAAIRKLKDGDGTYLYQVNVGAPDTFAGFPIFENPAIANIGTSNKSVLFGHLPSFKIATTGLNVAVSADAYFANDTVGYRFTYRVDGGLTHAAHVKYLVNA
jgi:HK97 family phage major capsid protein